MHTQQTPEGTKEIEFDEAWDLNAEADNTPTEC